MASINTDIVLPSKPTIVEEEGDSSGTYEIEGLYPGYGYTLGNSLRRIILSSLPGAAITTVKINGVKHEFSTIDGVKEDVITILMRLKNVCFKVSSEEPQQVTINADGEGEVTADDIETPGQVEVTNPDLHLATITNKDAELKLEMQVKTGLGYMSKEDLKDEKVDTGELVLDAVFSPIRRVNYKVEEMRVGDRTDFNRLKIMIETDGTITPREALETAIITMIRQLQEVVDLKEPVRGPEEESDVTDTDEASDGEDAESEDVEKGHEASSSEFLKTRIESLDLSTRTTNALERASIRTAGGLVRKTRDDLLAIDGLGEKGVGEIEEKLSKNDVALRDS